MLRRVSFQIIMEGFGVPVLVGNAGEFVQAVIGVCNGIAVSVCGAGDIAGIILGIFLGGSVRGCSLYDPAPVIQQVGGSIPVAVFDSGNVSSCIIDVFLRACFLLSAVGCEHFKQLSCRVVCLGCCVAHSVGGLR